uniref:Vacuolar protein sorting-associated protein 72 homolog n=1 Tax=Sinocyclocheilus anshuiensis TaxID=1608454 RepID=A0A671LEZ9_9TELE
MSLASSREQRSTAGSRMSKLLDAEEEDEFYKTTYGGFNDVSINVYIYIYIYILVYIFDLFEVFCVLIRLCLCVSVRKSVRKSTSEHTRQTNERLQERQLEAPRKRRGALSERVLTQDELLAEAKLTAESNLRSLENYERLEADKKKQVHKKRRFEGPSIRYHSVLMLLVPDAQMKEENVDVEGLDQDTPQATPTSSSSAQGAGPLCSRTYITFSDDETFSSAFPASARSSPAQPVQEVCPVTHKPALYRDPVTDIPYANARAFRIIREAYQKYIAAHGFPNASGNFSGNSDFSVSPAVAAKSTRPKAIVKHTVVAT